MGSDLFSVNVEKYKELKTKEAIRSALLRGENTEQVYHFFEFQKEDEWIEITMFINTVHPDACVEIDELFFTRVLDEAVCDWQNPSPINWENTPLRKLYPELWNYPEKLKPVIFVSTIKYFPGKPVDKYAGGLDDAVEVTIFIPKKYAPNIKGLDYWDSRAWGGVNPGYSYKLEDSNKPKKMIVKELERDIFLVNKMDESKRLYEFNKEKKIWVKSKKKFPIENEVIYNGNISWFKNEILVNSSFNTYKIDENYNINRFSDKKGKILNFNDVIEGANSQEWFASKKGVLHKVSDNEIWYKKADGLHTNNISKLFILKDNRVLAYSKSGLSIFEDDSWKILDNYTLKKIEHITVDENDNIWLIKGKNIEVITVKGELKTFPKAKWKYVTRLIPFVGSKVILTSNDAINLLDLETLTIKIIVDFNEINEIDISSIRTDSKYNLWGMVQGNLVLFKNNEKPIYFIFNEKLPIKKDYYSKYTYDNFFITPGDDIWILVDSTGFVKISNETIQKAINSEQLNSEFVNDEDIPIINLSINKKTKKVNPKVKKLNKVELAKKFPNSNKKGSSFKANSKLTRSLCENGRALGEKSIETILNKHLKALETFNGGYWQTLDVSGMVMAILSGGSQDLASFSNKKISDKVKLLNRDLRYSNFCSSLAENVIFDNSNLENAIFTDSFMKNASFKNCNMKNVDFSRADLRNVNFENANLEACDFENANLEAANFKGALGLDNATFPGANLNNVIV